MKIHKAQKSDLDNIMKMYKSCVAGMIKGGIDQWDDTYPDTETIAQDLEDQTYYVMEEKGEIIGGINIDQNQQYNQHVITHITPPKKRQHPNHRL